MIHEKNDRGEKVQTTVWEAPIAKIPVRATITVPPLTAMGVDRSMIGRVHAPTVADAAVFLTAAACTTGTVVIRNWDTIAQDPSAQVLREVLATMGAYVVRSAEGLTCTSRSTSGHLTGISIDLAGHPDLIAPIFVLCSLADDPSVIHGLAAHPEITRQVVADMISVGADVLYDERTAVITPRELHGGEWMGTGTASSSALGAVLGLVVPDMRVFGIDLDSSEGRAFLAEWSDALAADEHILPGATRGTVPYYT